LDHDNFKDVIRSAIMLGNDTDTTACVAGGLAGIYFGYDQLPKDWLEQLKGQDIVENLLAKLALQLSSKS
jgi:ADP-ribosylglycohydrolase